MFDEGRERVHWWLVTAVPNDRRRGVVESIVARALVSDWSARREILALRRLAWKSGEWMSRGSAYYLLGYGTGYGGTTGRRDGLGAGGRREFKVWRLHGCALQRAISVSQCGSLLA
jgi:hypothetical protein